MLQVLPNVCPAQDFSQTLHFHCENTKGIPAKFQGRLADVIQASVSVSAVAFDNSGHMAFPACLTLLTCTSLILSLLLLILGSIPVVVTSSNCNTSRSLQFCLRSVLTKEKMQENKTQSWFFKVGLQLNQIKCYMTKPNRGWGWFINQ